MHDEIIRTLIRDNKRLVKELVAVTQKLTKNEVFLNSIKGDEDHD